MTKPDHIQYWRTSSEKDWEVAKSLFDNGKYPQSLFLDI